MAKKQKYDKSNEQVQICDTCKQKIKLVMVMSNGKKSKVKMCGC